MRRRTFTRWAGAILAWPLIAGMTQAVDPFADDETHPIPFLAALDVLAKGKDGGVILVIVIASPLKDDQRSLERLMRKLENYLGFIQSAEFKDEFGAPSADKVEIQLVVHPDSSPRVFTVLERCKPWALENDATLTVERR